MKRISFAAYNLGPAGDRPRRQGRREILAILRKRDAKGRRRKVLALFEAIDWRLPRVMPWLLGYRLIRDTSTPGRANLALYVLRRLKVTDVEWIDHEREWPRVLHDGNHPARATLFCRVEDWPTIVGHGPQAATPEFWERFMSRERAQHTAVKINEARDECLSIWVRLLRAHDRVLLLTDPNGLGDDLMRAVSGMRTGGTAVEAAHVKGGALSWRTRAVVNGVRMLSDHKRVLLGRARKT
jgi:hypothetical protein